MLKKDLYEIGEIPPIGHIPKYMYAHLIRRERYGEPLAAFQIEKVPMPTIKPAEVLVFVMAAGINYNNVWASLGIPVCMISVQQKDGDPSDFHIGGSDASGIVYAVGKEVKNVKVGDKVVIHCGMWDSDCPFIKAGGDPILSPTNRIWGFETNFGSFAQFTKVQDHQCLPKPKHLTWEAAAAYILVGATAYRMLLGCPPHIVHQGDVVLIWGGSGGLGTQAIQIVKIFGGIPIAVVSSEERGEYCISLGARGYINRKKFNHWGMMPHWKDTEKHNQWLQRVRAFGRAIWDIVGEKKNPWIVFEHPSEDTLPTSMIVCDWGGMVVICAGTTGYNGVVDLRCLWMRQKRLQGSHFANDEQCEAFNKIVIEGLIDPCLAKPVFKFHEIQLAHQLMYENRQPVGNMAALVGAPREGLKDIL